jgi:hypothetical protein
MSFIKSPHLIIQADCNLKVSLSQSKQTENFMSRICLNHLQVNAEYNIIILKAFYTLAQLIIT